MVLFASRNETYIPEFARAFGSKTHRVTSHGSGLGGRTNYSARPLITTPTDETHQFAGIPETFDFESRERVPNRNQREPMGYPYDRKKIQGFTSKDIQPYSNTERQMNNATFSDGTRKSTSVREQDIDKHHKLHQLEKELNGLDQHIGEWEQKLNREGNQGRRDNIRNIINGLNKERDELEATINPNYQIEKGIKNLVEEMKRVTSVAGGYGRQIQGEELMRARAERYDKDEIKALAPELQNKIKFNLFPSAVMRERLGDFINEYKGALSAEDYADLREKVAALDIPGMVSDEEVIREVRDAFEERIADDAETSMLLGIDKLFDEADTFDDLKDAIEEAEVRQAAYDQFVEIVKEAYEREGLDELGFPLDEFLTATEQEMRLEEMFSNIDPDRYGYEVESYRARIQDLARTIPSVLTKSKTSVDPTEPKSFKPVEERTQDFINKLTADLSDVDQKNPEGQALYNQATDALSRIEQEFDEHHITPEERFNRIKELTLHVAANAKGLKEPPSAPTAMSTSVGTVSTEHISYSFVPLTEEDNRILAGDKVNMKQVKVFGTKSHDSKDFINKKISELYRLNPNTEDFDNKMKAIFQFIKDVNTQRIDEGASSKDIIKEPNVINIIKNHYNTPQEKMAVNESYQRAIRR